MNNGPDKMSSNKEMVFRVEPSTSFGSLDHMCANPDKFRALPPNINIIYDMVLHQTCRSVPIIVKDTGSDMR